MSIFPHCAALGDTDEIYSAETTDRRTRSATAGVRFHAPLPTRRERESSLSPPTSRLPEEESSLDVEVMPYESIDKGYNQIHDRVGDGLTPSADFEYLPNNNFEYLPDENLGNERKNFITQFHSTLRDRDLNLTNDNNQNDVTQSSDDPAVRIANAMEQTFLKLRDQSFSGDSKLVNRMFSTKKLPTFSGDPIGWVKFKQAYELSTKLGDYSDSENAMRLSEALKDDACKATTALFAAGNSAAEIMKALEMRFGNSIVIINHLISQIDELPRIDARKTNLVEFATDVKSAVSAIKSLDDTEYLCNPQLASSIADKMPNSMMNDYIKYAAADDRKKPVIQKLSDFLYREAESLIAAGVLAFSSIKVDSKKKKPERRGKNNHNFHQAVCVTSINENANNMSNQSNFQGGRCVHCGHKNHQLSDCKDFIKAPLVQRWKITKSKNLCFNCLKGDHVRENCNNKKRCDNCNRKHHSLLHFTEKFDYMRMDKNTKTNSEALQQSSGSHSEFVAAASNPR